MTPNAGLQARCRFLLDMDSVAIVALVVTPWLRRAMRDGLATNMTDPAEDKTGLAQEQRYDTEQTDPVDDGNRAVTGDPMPASRVIIDIAAVNSALILVAGQAPTKVSLEKAAQIIGPDLRKMIKEGWLDEDLAEKLSPSNPNPVLSLLTHMRDQEKRARRKRLKTKRLKTASDKTPSTLMNAASSTLALVSPATTPSNPSSVSNRPTLSTTPTLASVALGRNRGIRPKKE